MLRTPYFAAETDIGQLNVIIRARGTPTETDWPGMKLLPDYFSLEKYPPTPLRSIFSAAGDDALDLLDKLLCYDPLKRPTCGAALLHSYFTNFPRPTPKEKLPRDPGHAIKRKAAIDDDADGIDEKASKVAKKLF